MFESQGAAEGLVLLFTSLCFAALALAATSVAGSRLQSRPELSGSAWVEQGESTLRDVGWALGAVGLILALGWVLMGGLAAVLSIGLAH